MQMRSCYAQSWSGATTEHVILSFALPEFLTTAGICCSVQLVLRLGRAADSSLLAVLMLLQLLVGQKNIKQISVHGCLVDRQQYTYRSMQQSTHQLDRRLSSTAQQQAVCQLCTGLTWNSHAIGAQITQSQNSATICHNNDLHIMAWPVAHDLIEAALLSEG